MGRGSFRLHRRVELFLAVFGAEAFAVESAKPLCAAIGVTPEDGARAEELNETGFLHLLLEAVLERIVRFRCFLYSVDGHTVARE